MCIPLVPYLKNEWLASLQELHQKWGGKLKIPEETVAPEYATLLTDVKGHKIYLSREASGDGPYLEIYVYGRWETELYLRREDLHDRFLKAIGLEYEIALEGIQVDTVVFNKKYLIKGEPREFVTVFLSGNNIRDMINKMGEFWVLNIKDKVAKIIYDIESSEIIRSDNLTDTVTCILNFLEVLEKKESGEQLQS